MRWFEGGIPNAIQQAKSNKSVFIVFIAGEDEKSTEMESYLHKDDVTGICEENNCVAVRLAANGNEVKFFSQIYPVVVIPSTFFIGDNGLPLEVIGECRSHADFLAKVKNAIQLQRGGSAAQSSSEQSASAPQAQQQQQQQPTTVPPTAAATDDSLQGQDAVSAGAAAASSAGSGDDVTEEKGGDENQTEDLEERVEKAKRLVEQKREEKTKKEAEDEKRREIERRSIGQGVQKLRQQQKENEVLEAKLELKKDREEDRLARQRVKEEIERDRIEKAARFSKEKDERAKAAEEARKKKLLEQQAAQVEEQARRSDIARIQFRMPDGSSVTQQFPATDTFASVHQFITQHMGSAVSLSMAFPRRTFTIEDHSRTLQELQLAPSAVILVIPGGVSTSVVRSSSGILSLSGITNLIFAPIMFIWNMLASLLGFNRPSSTSGSGSRPQSAPASTSYGGDRNKGSAQKRPASTSRQEGSIRRFRNAQDDEDDKDRNTWNGNSTQQM